MYTRYSKSMLDATLYKRKNTCFLKWFDNDIKMELLFMIVQNQHDQDWNISRYISTISSAPQSNSMIELFIRMMVSVGAFKIVHLKKLSSKNICISSQLKSELTSYYRMINNENLQKSITPAELDAFLTGETFGCK